MESRWINGTELNAKAQAEAKARFVHRWTHENAKQTYGGRCPGCVQAMNGGRIITGGAPGFLRKEWTVEAWHEYHAPLMSDAQWLENSSFAVTESGNLCNKVNHCLTRHVPGVKAERAAGY